MIHRNDPAAIRLGCAVMLLGLAAFLAVIAVAAFIVARAVSIGLSF